MGTKLVSFNIKLSTKEKATIEAKAYENGFDSVSGYVRYMALHYCLEIVKGK